MIESANWIGGKLDDPELLPVLPTELREFLLEANGLVAFDGGLHIRGAVVAPEWHSLRYAWKGPRALHSLFTAIAEEDVPFGEDVLGDQYFLRSGSVHVLKADLDEAHLVAESLEAFLRWVAVDPVANLSLEPLKAFQGQGGSIEPGQSLNVYPPFCFSQSAEGVSYRAVPALEQIEYLADLSSQLKGLPDGAPINFVVR